jgi:Sensors of blue-light using FAD
MFRLIYRSKEREKFSSLELKTLLARARLRNRAVRVTGMLIYKEGDFLQVLEGDDDAVKKTFLRIENDPRHGDLCVMQHAEFVRGRCMFGKWSMGFADITDTAFMLSGFINTHIGLDLWALDNAGAMDLLVARSRAFSSRSRKTPVNANS